MLKLKHFFAINFHCFFLLLFLIPSPVNAQCSAGGIALNKGCLGLSLPGCCTLKNSAAGIQVTTVQWCENNYICSLTCNPLTYENAYCGWITDPQSGMGLYDCTYAQSADPTNKNPYFCNIPCEGITSEGCCEGQTLLKYCKDGSLNFVNCAANTDAKYQFCGWDPVEKDYSCTISPVQGPSEFPYTCGSACKPDCTGKQCGTNGCGGSCGTCQGKSVCNEQYKCVAEPCNPECKNKECGSDLCSGVCGTCIPPKVCSSYYKCVNPSETDVSVEQDIPVINDPGMSENLDVSVILYCPEGTANYYGTCKPVAEDIAEPEKKSTGCMFFSAENNLSAESVIILISGFFFLQVFRKILKKKINDYLISGAVSDRN
jgi:hypothetical protein